MSRNKITPTYHPISDSLSKQNTLSRSSDIYFEDGNIVLIADNVAFRVHKGQLIRRSEIFKDMLAVVEQPADAEVFDNCPAVRLADPSNDVLRLLSTLYDSTQFHAVDVPTLAVVVRMSDEYSIDGLRKFALEALRKIYPDTLSDWDKYEGDRDLTPHVVILANADILLPAAYYALCDWFMSQHVHLHLGATITSLVFRAHTIGREILAVKLADFVQQHLPGHAKELYCGQRCREAWRTLEDLRNKSASPPRRSCIYKCPQSPSWPPTSF